MNALAKKEEFDMEAALEASRGYQGAEPGEELSTLFSKSGLSPSWHGATPISGTMQLHEDGLAYGKAYQFVGQRNRFNNWSFNEGHRVFDQILTDGLLIPSTDDAFCYEYVSWSIHAATYVIVFGNTHYPLDYYGDTYVSQYWLSPNVDEKYVITRIASLYDDAMHYRR